MCGQPVAEILQQPGVQCRHEAKADCSQMEPPCKRLKSGNEHFSEDVAHGLVTALVTDLINNLVTNQNVLPGMRG